VTREQQLAVLRSYDIEFSRWEPERTERERCLPVGMGRGLKHARWMTLEMLRRLEADEEASAGQADRWIGFIQGIFWMTGIYSIGDMASANTKEIPNDD